MTTTFTTTTTDTERKLTERVQKRLEAIDFHFDPFWFIMGLVWTYLSVLYISIGGLFGWIGGALFAVVAVTNFVMAF